MNERLLQFIWQFRYFNQAELCTAHGIPVRIMHPGRLNAGQGPDFEEARIYIGDTLWVGQVELHLKASDWMRHGHQHDAGYQQVILHVVWQADMAITDSRNNAIPTLELQTRVSQAMLHHYQQWMHSQAALPCHSQLPQVKELVWLQAKERMLVERLQQKTELAVQMLQQSKGHWEQVCWQMLCRYFGGKTNAESFMQIAQSLPIEVLGRHKTQIIHLEALLLGQAGLLHKALKDDYAQLLWREYRFLQQKYGLQVINKPPVFLRMRPPNFPTIRLAQLAMLICKSGKLFSKLLQMEQVAEAYALFDVVANDYWHYRYKFDQPTPYQPKHLGGQMIETILINAVVPLVFAYGKQQGMPQYSEKALQWLQHIRAEQNILIKPFVQAGLPMPNAGYSQAALQLRLHYCDARRCLECAIGNNLLKQFMPIGS